MNNWNAKLIKADKEAEYLNHAGNLLQDQLGIDDGGTIWHIFEDDDETA